MRCLQAKLDRDRAKAQDPTVFQYDEVYDEIVQKKNEKKETDKKADEQRKVSIISLLLFSDYKTGSGYP